MEGVSGDEVRRLFWAARQSGRLIELSTSAPHPIDGEGKGLVYESNLTFPINPVPTPADLILCI